MEKGEGGGEGEEGGEGGAGAAASHKVSGPEVLLRHCRRWEEMGGGRTHLIQAYCPFEDGRKQIVGLVDNRQRVPRGH